MYTIRVVILVAMLIVVVAMLRGIRPQHVQRFFGMVGAGGGGEASAPVSDVGTEKAPNAARPAQREGKADTFKLCSTRVHALVWNDGRKIEEFKQGMKMKWMAYDPEPRELVYLDMERWLSQYCQVSTRVLSAEDVAGQSFKPALTVELIDGTKKVIEQSGQDVFKADGQIFESPDLVRGLAELKSIAAFKESP